MLDTSAIQDMVEAMPCWVPLSDQIREAIRDSGMSQYRLCMEAEVDQGAMSRFLAGKVGMSLAALDRVAKVLELRIEPLDKQQKTR